MAAVWLARCCVSRVLRFGWSAADEGVARRGGVFSSRSEWVVVKWHMALQAQCQLLANPQIGVRQTWKEWSRLR